MNKLFALAAGITLSLATACGGDNSEDATTGSSTTTIVEQASTTPPAVSECDGQASVTVDPALSAAPATPQFLTDVQVTTGPNGDQIVFIFEGATLPGIVANVSTEPLRNTEDSEVLIDGETVVSIVFLGGTTVDLSGETFRTTYNSATSVSADTTRYLTQAVLVDDFEGQMLWGVGLNAPCDLSVAGATSPARVIVDIPSAA